MMKKNTYLCRLLLNGEKCLPTGSSTVSEQLFTSWW